MIEPTHSELSIKRQCQLLNYSGPQAQHQLKKTGHKYQVPIDHKPVF
jgi:hypothetical protein